MTNLLNIPTQDGYETALSQELSSVGATFTVNTAPSYLPTTTDTYVTINPGKSNQEVVLCTSYVAATKTFTITTRAISMSLGVTATAQTHSAGSKVIISDNFAFWNDIQTAMNTKVDGVTQGFPSYTTTDRDLLSVANGAMIYNTTTGELNQYIAGAWSAVASGSTQPNASTTVAGKVEEATAAEQGAGTGTGGTGARLFVNPSNLVKTSAGAGDENKVPVLNSSGKLADGFQSVTAANGSTLTASTTSDASALHTHGAVAGTFKFGGTGADGAIGAGALTITGSNDTYIVKNYTSFAPGANTVTVTPTGCIVHFRISGNCDLTGTTLSFASKGAAGGVGLAVGSTANAVDRKLAGGGVPNGTTTAGAGSANTIVPSLTYVLSGGKTIVIGPGSGGGGVASSVNGGAGGGCLILEVAGNLTYSSTTGSFAGAAGTAGGAGQGGAGGGGSGSFLAVYNGTLSGTFSPTVTGGAGGAYGGGGATVFPAGGGGSITTNGAAGDGGTGVGGAGGAGEALTIKNTFFA